MKRITRILAAAILGAVLLTLLSGQADAGRTSRRYLTIAPGESAQASIPLFAMESSAVSAASLGRADLELYVYDGNGNVWVGNGPWGRKSARVNVFQSGNFDVEVRNVGPNPSIVLLQTQ